MATDKTQWHQVTFQWGSDSYYSLTPGVTNVTINIVGATDKFSALHQAWDKVAALVNNVEPTKMNCELRSSRD